MGDTAGWVVAPCVHDATTVGHLVLNVVLTGVVVVHGVDDAQVDQQPVKNLKRHKQ